MSAQTRQETLTGDVVGTDPRDGRSAALWRLPPDVSLQEAALWSLTAHDRDAERVLRWLERAKREGVIVTEVGAR